MDYGVDLFSMLLARGGNAGGGGGSVTIDTQVSPTSRNPVENRAIYSFVNSSIATNTAYFKGTYKNISALDAIPEVTNNDYAFIIVVESAILTTTQPEDWSTNYTDYYTYSEGVYYPVTGNTAPTWEANTYYIADGVRYDRYKYNSITQTWLFEYSLNNSSFTDAEWSTIQSGLTASDKTQIYTNQSNITNLSNSLKPVATSGSYNDLTDKPTIPAAANNATLTIKRNNSSVGTFTANASADVDVNISVPTQATDINALPNTTKYAGSSSVAGAATSANKLNTDAGSTTQPVYFSNGIPVATTYALNKTVPSDAVFTDTTYTSKAAASGGTDVSLVTTGEKYVWDAKQTALSATQLTAVNSGIDSTKVTQISENEAALVDIIDSGVKNYILNTATDDTVATVDFTVNTNGSVLVNGTATTAAWFKITDNLTLEPGTYKISGGEVVSGTVNVRVVYSPTMTASDIIADSNGNNTTFTLTATTTANVYIRMSTGRTASNVTVYPMICTKSAWDISGAYALYAPSNRQLDRAVNGLSNTTVKNLLQSTAKATDVRTNITFTRNADDTVTITSTSANTNNTDYYINSALFLKAGKYRLTGCPSGGNNTSTFKLQISGIGYDLGDGFDFTLATDQTISVYIRIWGGYAPNNITFNPMIKVAEITDTSYMPPAPSNRELYEVNVTQDESIGILANTGAKNLLNFTALGSTTTYGKTYTSKGVTFTLNDDNSISLSGTNDNTDQSHCRLILNNALSYITDFCDGKHILSGISSPGGTGKWTMSAYVSGGYNQIDSGSGVLLTTPSSGVTNIFIDIAVAKGVNTNGGIIRPMIRHIDFDESYVPYAPTNRELYTGEIITSTGYGANVDSTKAVECDYSFTMDADIVTLQFRLVLNVEVSVTNTFAMLMVPKGYRPPVKTVWGTGYANNKTVCMWCNTAGEIRMRVDEAIPANSTIAGTIVYSRNSSTWKTLPTASS